MKKTFDLNRELIFFTPSKTLLKVQGVTGAIAEQNDKPLNYYLTLQVSFPQYQLIEQEHLFNLKPEVCSPLIDRQFNSEVDLTLELMLKPGLLPKLTQKGSDVAAIITTLEQHPSEEPPQYQLTENWFCLSVRQTQGDENIGYSTLWDWANPETLEEFVNQGKETFQGWGEQLQTALESLALRLRSGLTPSELVPSEANIVEVLENSLSKLTATVPISEPTSISQIVNRFFDEEDWDYVRLEDGMTLEMAFVGDNGRWSCLAQARDEDEQFLFYSICPIATPQEMRSQMAEFLTKANCGLILGNFELDYSDGEISYKTSIDVEGDRLTSALIESLVYTNVTMMDRYLPSITAVLNGMSPDNAIALVETD
ncbi:MAG: YbjN domain-containing protein [Cyanobacteria bacterium J06592_8]